MNEKTNTFIDGIDTVEAIERGILPTYLANMWKKTHGFNPMFWGKHVVLFACIMITMGFISTLALVFCLYKGLNIVMVFVGEHSSSNDAITTLFALGLILSAAGIIVLFMIACYRIIDHCVDKWCTFDKHTHDLIWERSWVCLSNVHHLSTQ